MGDDDQHHSSTPNPDSSSTATSTTISTSNRKSVHQSLGGGAVPPMYHKFQDHIDDKLNVTHKALSRQYSKIDENILSKLSKAPVKDKKIQ
ncbi:hypothetical protein C5167_013762 [Papaver somniferum]|uniref:Reticulon domain-containing protein n=1 Tax=Papaver somniferum TaxID=3469 RepID=A0A4Y7J4E6_PAPSO|nr:hypothetical protein C5167_013762 [Papaver somniferum]